jgi:hypothetical protein
VSVSRFLSFTEVLMKHVGITFSIAGAALAALALVAAPQRALPQAATLPPYASAAPSASPTAMGSANPMETATANPMETVNPLATPTATPGTLEETSSSSAGTRGGGSWGLLGLLGLLGLIGLRGSSRTP